jgi:hypothetical protein
MLELLSKLKSHEFLIEGIVLTVIGICLVLLFFRIVITNMGVKAIFAGWLTACGATAILAYSIFWELKDETEEKSINTCVRYNLDWQPVNCMVDFVRAFEGGNNHLFEEVYRGNIIIKAMDSNSVERFSTAPVELVVLNVIDHFTSTIRDWRTTSVSTPLSKQTSFRPLEMAHQSESVFKWEEFIQQCRFKTIETNYLDENYDHTTYRFDGYAIWPKKSKIEMDGNRVVVTNPNFLFEVEVLSGNGAIPIENIGEITTVSDSDNCCWLTSQQVIIRYTLRKSRAGHCMRSEYRDFCKWLIDSLTNRLEANKEDLPKVIIMKNKQSG